jgi:UDP:flavonoid glycosyltransferase YjiC (YdhE family)
LLPWLSNFGETFPLIAIAQKYRERGGDCLFVGFPMEYNKYIITKGFRFVVLETTPTSDEETRYRKKIQNAFENYYQNKIPQEKIYTSLFSSDIESRNQISQEIKILKNENVDVAVSTYSFPSLFSARLAKIPIITIISGVVTPMFFEENRAVFPDGFENCFTRFVPQRIKDYFINEYIQRCKWGVKWYNDQANEYGLPRLQRFLDLFRGDQTLVADDLNFINIAPTLYYPKENFIGPIVPDQAGLFKFDVKDPEVDELLKKPGKTILVGLGTLIAKNIFTEIIETLNTTSYKVLASHKGMFEMDTMQIHNENMVVHEFFPSIQRLQMQADLSIISGGRGAIYTAALSGRPIIGIPMHAEQQWNLNNLLRHGVGIQISKKYFTKKKLIKAIEQIFSNYDYYRTNALHLQASLQGLDAPEVAVKRIMAITSPPLQSTSF